MNAAGTIGRTVFEILRHHGIHIERPRLLTVTLDARIRCVISSGINENFEEVSLLTQRAPSQTKCLLRMDDLLA